MAKEVVSEENGVLISTIIRQYFMSLKVIGKWKLFGPSMERTWTKMQHEIEHSHPIFEPKPPATRAIEALREKHTSPDRSGSSHSSKSRSRSPSGRHTPGGVHPEGSETPLDESADEFGSDDDEAEGDKPSSPVIRHEHELAIIRKVMKKWWRLAGIKGTPRACEELGEGEFQVNWTKAIAPRLEGRIKDVTPAA